jgi:hypothetical protein
VEEDCLQRKKQEKVLNRAQIDTARHNGSSAFLAGAWHFQVWRLIPLEMCGIFFGEEFFSFSLCNVSDYTSFFKTRRNLKEKLKLFFGFIASVHNALTYRRFYCDSGMGKKNGRCIMQLGVMDSFKFVVSIFLR